MSDVWRPILTIGVGCLLTGVFTAGGIWLMERFYFSKIRAARSSAPRGD